MIPQIDGQGLARSKDYVSGVMIRGIRSTDLPAKKLLWDNLNKLSKILENPCDKSFLNVFKAKTGLMLDASRDS